VKSSKSISSVLEYFVPVIVLLARSYVPSSTNRGSSRVRVAFTYVPAGRVAFTLIIVFKVLYVKLRTPLSLDVASEAR
jgi:Na+/melibiose symporter-like transporter